jgi:hypothetical protein
MDCENNDLTEAPRVVHCTPDKDDGLTVSFYCPHCQYRHTHGNPFCRTQPGEAVGTRTAHCHTMRAGPRFSRYQLVIGDEKWQDPYAWLG